MIVELDELCTHQVCAELDGSSDHIKAKIANAEQMKVHTMFVIGNRDLDANAVSVRLHGKGNLEAKPHSEVVADILAAIRERRASKPVNFAISLRTKPQKRNASHRRLIDANGVPAPFNWFVKKAKADRDGN